MLVATAQLEGHVAARGNVRPSDRDELGHEEGGIEGEADAEVERCGLGQRGTGEKAERQWG